MLNNRSKKGLIAITLFHELKRERNLFSDSYYILQTIRNTNSDDIKNIREEHQKFSSNGLYSSSNM